MTFCSVYRLMRVLLHTCCAPCATHCVDVLRGLDHEVVLFFSNANIAPDSEWVKRRDNVLLLADRMGIAAIIDETDHTDWCNRVAKGFELEKEKGARCAHCFRYSLTRTYHHMAENGFDGFTTTLSVSPHKHTPSLFKVGRELDAERFLAINFKKNDGFKNSLALAAELGLYRQNYCGCEFSIRPPGL